MRAHGFIPPLCSLVLFAATGCPASDGDDTDPSGMSGADPLVGTWNLAREDGDSFPYAYTDEDGCEATVSGQITFDASLRGTLRFGYDYGAGCGDDVEDEVEDSRELSAIPAVGGGYDINVHYLEEDPGLDDEMHCTLEGSTLECEDAEENDEGERDVTVFVRA